MPSILNNSFLFNVSLRPMILAEINNIPSQTFWKDSSWVTYISNKGKIINKKYSDCARSRSIKFTSFRDLAFCKLSEESFSFSTTFSNGFNRIFRKAILSDNDLMKIVLQKVCAFTSSMPIINSEKWAFGPFLAVFFRFWPHYI